MIKFWFKRWLNESVSVSISSYEHPKNTAKDISELANGIKNELYKSIPEFRKGTNPELFTIDGLDVSATEGVLNFYTKDIPTQAITKIISGIKYFLDNHKVKYGPFRKDMSRMFSGEEVYRIPILNLPLISDRPPEINMANDVAHIIFNQLLGFNVKIHEGQINARELLYKIDSLPEFGISQAATSPNHQGNLIDFGISEERLRRHLGTLRQIAKWAIDKDYDTVNLH